MSFEPTLPPVAEINLLWNRFGMPDNIRRHSSMVCELATKLGSWLIDSGVELRMPVIQAGALLHDIAKAPCLGTKLHHDVEGRRILDELGYPQLGELVGHHVFLPEGRHVDETMVVYYADKRVQHDVPVPLQERFRDIVERYGGGDENKARRIERGYRRAREVEAQLFSLVPPRGPHELP